MRTGDLTLVSTKNIDLTNTRVDAKNGKRVTGEDCQTNILGIPLGLPTLQTAIDRALEIGGGNIMLDEAAYVKNDSYILFGKHCIIAEGAVINTSVK